MSNAIRIRQHNPHRTEAYRNRFFISQKHKLCYVGVDKVANTSLKWWMAEIEGLSGRINDAINQRGLNASKGIHTVYPLVAPRLVLDSFSRIREVFHSGEFYCFTLVRNPYTRLFSAWTDKVLRGKHFYTRKLLADKKFYARPATGIEGVRKGFEAFVAWLHTDPNMLQADRHWMPQFFLLRPDLLHYDFIGKIEEADLLEHALAAVLKEPHAGILHGKRPQNRMSLPYHQEFVTVQAQKMIREMYADDFDHLGYEASLPHASLPVDEKRVEKTLMRFFMERAEFTQQRLAFLEAEKLELETNPGKAFVRLFRSLSFPLKYAWTRSRHFGTPGRLN